MKLAKISICMAVTILAASPACAMAMTIKPGKWEFRSTTNAGAPGGAREHVNQQCLSDPVLRPETMMKDMNEGCQLVNSANDGNSMSWNVSCTGSAGDMSGIGNVRMQGDAIVGSMTMTMSFNDQTMNMEMSWHGTYLGACD